MGKNNSCDLRIAQATKPRNIGLGITSAFLITSLVILGLGAYGFISLSVFAPEEPEPAFTPVIDGFFNETEHWDLAENMHTTFLEVDENHTETYNYVYASRTNTSVLVCLDMCSDTTDDAEEGEWISLWIDSDNSRNIWNYTSLGNLTEVAESLDNNVSLALIFEEYVNYIFNYMNFYSSFNNGTELLIFDVSTGNHYKNFTNNLEPSGLMLNSTCTYEVAYSFMSTPNFEIPHRVFEFNITLSSLENLTATSDYGLLVEGYGTMAFSFGNWSSFDNFDFYTMPNEISGAYWNAWITWVVILSNTGYNESLFDYKMFNEVTEVYVMLTLPTVEDFYYRMGKEVNDLNGPA
jgi:hypothetical protein